MQSDRPWISMSEPANNIDRETLAKLLLAFGNKEIRDKIHGDPTLLGVVVEIREAIRGRASMQGELDRPRAELSRAKGA